MVKRSKKAGRISQFIHGIATGSEMPLDILLDVAKVTLIGGVQVHVEGHRGVLLFTSDAIVIRTRAGALSIKGRELIIGGIYRELVVVEGRIEAMDLYPGEVRP